MSQYNRLTPGVQVIKRQIAAVLHADDGRATIGAVADYLGVFCRALMSKMHDPHTAENAHIVSAGTLLPPGYTPAELVLYNFNSASKVWRPGQDFKQHMDARLQQMFPAPGVSASGSISIPGVTHAPVPQPPGAASMPTEAPAGYSEQPAEVPVPLATGLPTNIDREHPGEAPLASGCKHSGVTAPLQPVANPDLTALLQHVVYLNLGANYPISGLMSLAAAGPLYRSGVLIIDLYKLIYNHPGDGPKLIQWVKAHIPLADYPEFVGSWKLATQQVKAAQVKWEAAGHRGELPPVPEVGMGRSRDKGVVTDPGLIAIRVALDKVEELRVRAVETRAAAVLNPELKSEFAAALLGFSLRWLDCGWPGR